MERNEEFCAGSAQMFHVFIIIKSQVRDSVLLTVGAWVCCQACVLLSSKTARLKDSLSLDIKRKMSQCFIFTF